MAYGTTYDRYKEIYFAIVNSTATLCTLRLIPICRIRAKKAAKLQSKLVDPTLQFIKILTLEYAGVEKETADLVTFLNFFFLPYFLQE